MKAHPRLNAGELHAEPLASARSVVIPFIVFTAIWGSTWIVIRGQLGVVPSQWSVTYRFAIGAIAMAVVARVKGQSLATGRDLIGPVLFLGFMQFCVNFNAVYLAERHVTSGLVATVFALLLIPNSLLAWAFLGQRPSQRFMFGAVLAIVGITLLFVHELAEHPAHSREILTGIVLTLTGMFGASAANVFQARGRVRRIPLYPLLAWSMAAGALFDGLIAFALAGPPTIDARPEYWAGLLYLALAASALAFSLYFPVVRKIGPGKAAYSSVLVPIMAMGFSTAFEGYHWTPLAAVGAVLALGGMAAALRRNRSGVSAPDAA